MRTRLGILLLAWMVVGASDVSAARVDAVGDVSVCHVAQAGAERLEECRTANEQENHGALDLVGVGMLEENADQLGLWLGVADIDAESAAVPGLSEIPGQGPQATYAIRFAFADQDYLVRVFLGQDTGTLYRVYHETLRAEAEIDVRRSDNGTGLDLLLPRNAVTGAAMEPLRAGSELADIWAASYDDRCSGSNDVRICDTVASDRAPDEGHYGSLMLTSNPDPAAAILVSSPEPTRFSNGMATTYLFQLDVVNVEAQSETLLFAAEEVPDDWLVDVPEPLDLEGGKAASVPVTVSVPFQHDHGARTSILVEVQRQSAPGQSVLQEFTVIWPEVPQPGGHHPQLWLHASDEENTAASHWMNTLQEDPEATGTRIPYQVNALHALSGASFSGGAVFGDATGLDILLNPGLKLGIETREAPGQAELVVASAIDGPVPLSGFVGIIQESHAEGENRVVELFSFELPENKFSSTGDNRLEIDLQPVAPVERYPYVDATNLVFRLKAAGEPSEEQMAQLAAAAATGNPPLFSIETSDSWLRLPLRDFHDELVPTDFLGSQIHLHADEDVLEINPGETRLFDLQLRGPAGKYDFNLIQATEGWANLHPDAGAVSAEGLDVSVWVDAPQDAAVGHAYYVAVHALGEDPSMRAARMLRVDVVGHDVQDDRLVVESLLPSQTREIPFGGTAGLFAVWAVVLLRRPS